MISFLAAKYAPCRFCDVVSLEHARSDLKLIQQTPADPASITINQPVFDHLNLDLKRLTDNCGLEKVDLPGNQFNKATQVIFSKYSFPKLLVFIMANCHSCSDKRKFLLIYCRCLTSSWVGIQLFSISNWDHLKIPSQLTTQIISHLLMFKLPTLNCLYYNITATSQLLPINKLS